MFKGILDVFCDGKVLIGNRNDLRNLFDPPAMNMQQLVKYTICIDVLDVT